MIDVLDVVTLVIAIFSVIFVGVTEGTKHTVGYRGSEETRNRKNRIDDKLKEEVKAEMKKFIEDFSAKKISEKELHIKFEELGYRGFVAINITEDLLDNSTDYMETGLKNLVGGTITLLVTFFVFFYLDLTDLTNLVVLLGYCLITTFLFWRGIQFVRKNYSLRKEFVWLDENPTLKYAVEKHEELLDRELL